VGAKAGWRGHDMEELKIQKAIIERDISLKKGARSAISAGGAELGRGGSDWVCLFTILNYQPGGGIGWLLRSLQ
jgi:hypothetical protein